MTNEERIYKLCGILIDFVDVLLDPTTCNYFEWIKEELADIREDIDNS